MRNKGFLPDLGRRKALLKISAAICGWAAIAPLRNLFAGALPTVSAADFGALPDGADAGPGLARACEAIARNGGGRLVIPPGAYLIHSKTGVALFFDNLSSIEIEAHRAELIFSGLTRPLAFRNCANVSVNGMTIAWARPPFSQGDVERLSADGKTVEIALDGATPMDGWTKVKAIGSYDRASALIQREGVDGYNAVQSVEALSPSVARLNLKWPIGLERARTLVLRHALFDAHAMNFDGCGSVGIEDVTVHSAPGMAFMGSYCGNVCLRRCVIAPKPSSGLLMSTCADGAHFSDCSGEILLDDCRFSRMGDDGLNVNTSYLRVVEVPDSDTAVVAQRWNTPFRDQDLTQPGHRFKFSSSQTLEPRGEDEVESVAAPPPAPQTRETIRFKHALPLGVKPGDVLLDAARSPRTIVRNCHFEANRARGVLAHQHAVIEDCVFRDLSMQGVSLSPDLSWMEGPEIADVRIIGNLFDGVDRQGLKQGAILIDAVVLDPTGRPRSSSSKPNHDIVIEGNQFKNIEGEPIVIRATG